MRLLNLGNVKPGGIRKGFSFPLQDKELVVETPACFIYTRNGFVPHMTPDLWETLDHLPKIIITSLNYIVEKEFDRIGSGKGFSHLARLPKETPVFLYQTDHTWQFKVYGTDNNSASVWAKGGRVAVKPSDFVRNVKASCPQIMQVLCDNESYPGCSRKRCMKSVERTTRFSETVLDQLHQPISSGEIIPFGSLIGGNDLRERQRCAEYMASQKQLKGFVLDGFCSKDDCFVKLNEDVESVLSVVQECVRHLPDDLPRFMPGVGPPADVVTAVESGINLFDGSFPCIASETGWAWTLDNSEDEVWIDFKKDAHQKNFEPIGDHCGCYTCRRHNRAYITHLVNTRELLAKTLLNIHNSHQYFRFFKQLRESIANGELASLKECLKKTPCPDELYRPNDTGILDNSRFR